VQGSGQVGGAHRLEGDQQVRGALVLLHGAEAADLGPVHDPGRAASSQSQAGGALDQRHLGDQPLGALGLLHGEVQDRQRLAVDLHTEVEHLADGQGLRRPLLEPAHVDPAAEDDRPGLDRPHPCDRQEDPPPGLHLDDQAVHAR
jgi:hypothetical protein